MITAVGLISFTSCIEKLFGKALKGSLTDVER